MTSFSKLLRSLLTLLFIGFMFGMTWGACVLGARLVQRLLR